MSGHDINANRPGYKETKVGWIPEEWECAELHTVVDSKRPICYGVVQTGDNEVDGVPCVRVTDLVEGTLDPTRMIKTSAKIHRQYRRTELKAGDLMIALRGDAGLAVDVPASLAGANLTRGVALLSKRDCYSSRYLVNALAAPATSLIFRRAVNGTALQEISIGTLKKISVAIPPLPEQNKIAEILSTCDEVIEKTGDLIEAKTRQKKALMQQLLSGEKRLTGFAGEWAEVKIGNLMKEVSRPVEWDDEELYRLVSVRRRSGGLFFREALHGRDIKTKVMHTTRENDFLISKMQVVHGAMAMTTAEFNAGHVSGSYITLVARERAPIHMPFFDHLSRTKWLYHLTFLSSYGVVIEKMTFNLRDFMKKEIRIPPTIEEQKAITDILDAAGGEIDTLEKRQSALKQQKKALMQQLLTGHLRVKV